MLFFRCICRRSSPYDRSITIFLFSFVLTSFSPVASHSSVLLIVCGHLVPTILHRLPLTNGHNVAVIWAVTFHVCTAHTFLVSVTQHPKLGPDRLLLRSIDHTQLDTNIYTHTQTQTSDRLFAQAATYTTHNKHKRRTFVPSAGFEPTIPAIEWPQTYALDRAASTYTVPSKGLPFKCLTTFIH